MKPMTFQEREATEKILIEVALERTRQHEKWGEQNHPDLGPVLMATRGTMETKSWAEFVSQQMEMPTATEAKIACENAFNAGQGSYAEIAIEEVAEAIEAAAGGPEHEHLLREELVQCAAVFVAWIESIDRRAAKRRGGDAL